MNVITLEWYGCLNHVVKRSSSTQAERFLSGLIQPEFLRQTVKLKRQSRITTKHGLIDGNASSSEHKAHGDAQQYQSFENPPEVDKKGIRVAGYKRLV